MEVSHSPPGPANSDVLDQRKRAQLIHKNKKNKKDACISIIHVFENF